MTEPSSAKGVTGVLVTSMANYGEANQTGGALHIDGTPAR
jgi:hypothetical protein